MLYRKYRRMYRRSVIGLMIMAISFAYGCGEIEHVGSTPTEEATESVSEIAEDTDNTIPEDTEDTEASESTEDSVLESITLEKVKLAKVVDGDTIWVTYGDDYSAKVRLIGIDTAESVHEDASRNNEYGTMASNHTKELLSGCEYVYLEYGEEKEDKYGRTLAYVWLSEDTSEITNMLNYRIIMDGYANVLTIAPNTKYSEQFTNMRDIDRAGRIGLWQYDEFQDLW